MSAERGGSLFGGRISVPWGSKCPFTREHGVGAAQFTRLVTWFPRNDVTASKVRWPDLTDLGPSRPAPAPATTRCTGQNAPWQNCLNTKRPRKC